MSSAPIPAAAPGGDQHLHFHVHPQADPVEERKLMAGLAAAVAESDAMVPPMPETFEDNVKKSVKA